MSTKNRSIAGSFAICGSIMIIAFVALINFITSPSHIWFVYPAFAVLWWPLAVFVPRRFGAKVFSICGCLLIIASLAVVNFNTSPSHIWFVYPAVAVLWWPLAVFVPRRFGAKAFSICGCLLIIASLAMVNFITSPSHIWFVYPAVAVLWWPLAVFVPRRFGARAFSICGCLLIIASLVVVNFNTSPSHIWFVYPAFAVLWWPLAVFVPRRFGAKAFSICGCLLIIASLVVVNFNTSPSHIWFVYPAVAVLWWPLAVFVPRRFGAKAFSICGCLLIIASLCIFNYFASPAYLWVVFAILPAILWPIYVFAGKRISTVPFEASMLIIIALYYSGLNIFFTHGFPWCLFIIYVAFWVPFSIFFAHKGYMLAFSIASTTITSLMLIIVNLLTTPEVIWFVYPVFALLWWPLSIYFFAYKKLRV
jgi:hypothetical protein